MFQAILILALSLLFPATLGYFPAVFGIAGGFILMLFLWAAWLWAKNRGHLEGPERLARDYQMASYVFFFVCAQFCCMMLGNPFSGLLFAEGTTRAESLPYHNSFASRAAIYFALGMLFAFLSSYVENKSLKSGQPEGS